MKMKRFVFVVFVLGLFQGERGAAQSNAAPTPEAHVVPEQRVPPSEPDSVTVETASEAEAQHSDPDEMRRKIDRALAMLSKEPSLEELQVAALRIADADAAETSRWKRGARLQAVLPTLKLTTDCDVGRDESLDRYQDDPDRWGADTDKGYGFQASATWRLSELVFNADELRVYDALADRAARRESLLSLLVGYYFERRRLQLTMMLIPPTRLAEMVECRMRISELTASIDALTGGLLSIKIKSNTAP